MTPLLSLLLLALAATPWKLDDDSDGLRVDRREVPGSDFDELRVTARRSESVQRLCDAIFAKNVDRAEGRFKKREILRETETERWTYEQIGVSFASDRDYVLHVKLEQPASSGRCEVSFETVDDPSRPPARGFVRIPIIRGRWSVAPAADGSNVVSYQVFSDPGGSLPCFLVRRGQRDAAVDFFKTILARAAK